MHVLATPQEDGAEALAALAQEFGAQRFEPASRLENWAAPQGALTALKLGQILATLLPENAIVSDEAASCSEIEQRLHHASPHDVLSVSGGAIGPGLPAAEGVALACPDRKVVALEADGAPCTRRNRYGRWRANSLTLRLCFSRTGGTGSSKSN